MFNLTEKTAIITGGSRGIGAEIAKKLANFGANIAVIDLYLPEKIGFSEEIIRKNEEKIGYFTCDVTDFSSCKDTVSKITAEFGKVDILVNNAGITRDNLIMTMPEEEFDSVINTNLKGAFNMIKACGRGFIKNKYGKIINIASVSGLLGTAGQANYAASKAGIIALTKVTAREFASKNVCCNAIAPGFIQTAMTQELNSENYLKQIPKGRLGTPEDVANLAAFLASEFSDYITGEVIRCDGGLAM